MQGTTYLNEMRHLAQVILDKHFDLKRIQVHILIGLPAASLFASSLQPVVGLGGYRVALTIRRGDLGHLRACLTESVIFLNSLKPKFRNN